MKNLHTFESFNEAKAKPGPDPYHRGLSDDDVEDKEDQIKKQAKMDDDDPDAYKEMPGDEEAREKGEVKKSKHTKSYDELYGDETDEALSDHEKEKEVDYDELYKEYPYKRKKRARRKNESVVTEACWDGYKKVGMKTKDGKQVPNCIPESELHVDEAVKLACIECDEVNTAGKWKKNKGFCPSCKTSSSAVQESFINEEKLDASAEKGLKNKADDTGVPIGILRDVYRRGMAAWKSGHRPGAGQQQWAYARVNSFLTKQPGTWGGADKDLAKKVRDGGHDKKLKKA